MDRLSWMHCFTRSVETGSFSAVAREMRTGQPNVSRQIAALEKHLGVRLLHRSTRQLTLTPQGARFYPDARRILDATREAECSARGEGKPQGLLRVACPTALGRTHLLPQLGTFLAKYPGIRIDVQIGDRFINLIEEGVDVAVRIGMPKDSALAARKVGLAERICLASVGYLAKLAPPMEPRDLLKHECVLYGSSGSANTWTLGGQDVAVTGRVAVNDPDGAYRAVIDDLGVGNAPVWLFERALLDGRVKALLLNYPIQPVPIYLVYSEHRLMPLRATVFMDFIAAAFSHEASLNEGSVAHVLRRLSV
ncbi:MAG: LysR substrate-binding domain-containing protein [Pseudomonadota bacterium]|nr:LysR substrate-binding domain-containing protein [Pseudomonadota bacterium]